LYLASLVGQRLGADQMSRLEAALHELVGGDGGSRGG
jgi:hypothetical protein